MRNWFIYKLGGIPKNHLPDYHYYPRRKKMFFTSIEVAKKGAKHDHPEYMQTYLDTYALTSFAKRFLGDWIMRVNNEK